MKKYEKEFKLKSIYLAIVRRFDIIAIFFVPLCLGSLVYTQFFMKKNYVSEISVAKSSIITNEQYQNIQTSACKSENIQKTIKDLNKKNIKHSNGNSVTSSDIINGLVFPAYQSNSITASFSFTSTDKAIVKDTLDILTSYVIEDLTPRSAYSDLSVYKDATDPYLNKKNTKYFLIACAAGLAISLAAAIIYEISSDEVYDISDVAKLGVSGTEIKLKKN